MQSGRRLDRTALRAIVYCSNVDAAQIEPAESVIAKAAVDARHGCNCTCNSNG